MKISHHNESIGAKFRTSLGFLILRLVLGAVLVAQSALAADQPKSALTLPSPNLSFRNEIQHAIDQGLRALLASQNSNGWWSTPDHPSVTALALTAYAGDPAGRQRPDERAAINKGYAFILGCAKPDGSIYQRELINYNTSISMMALLAARKPEYEPVLRRARAYLVGSQLDLDEPGKPDSPFDGGVGYGSKYQHSDMNNTLCALEALYYSKHLVADRPAEKDLNWAAAIHFLQNCQNLPGHNQSGFATDDPRHRGGFYYYPGNSMAGSETNAATGRVALRSYGSVSYAGLLSYIYANLQRDDSRVVAVLDWLRQNYTLAENPGMGPQGLYYYLHLMTKALTIYGADTLELKDGRKIDWRREVAMRLMALQKPDGSFVNENPRWWEKDASLVTAYSVIALEQIYRGL